MNGFPSYFTIVSIQLITLDLNKEQNTLKWNSNW